MTKPVILGLNAAGFNTSSVLIADGIPVFACEEERLVREKRTRRFPARGIMAALAHAGLRLCDVDRVAIAWNPAVNLEAHNAAQSARARYLGELFYSVPSHLMALCDDAVAVQSRQLISLADGTKLDVSYLNHHTCHAASFLASPFEEAAILTMDAFGEKESTTFSLGRGNEITRLWSQEFPHSLGAFYSAFTEYCGFEPQSDEWKLMGASSFGDPMHFKAKVASLVKLLPDGGFELDLAYFNHFQFHRPGRFTSKLPALLGLSPRASNDPLTQDHYDLAAAVQAVLEDVYWHLLRSLHRRTGVDAVVLAGGVALNCVANGRIRAMTPFRQVFVPPVPDDSGGALGAALFLHAQDPGARRSYVMDHNYLGPGYSEDEIAATLSKFKLEAELVADPASVAAELIAGGHIIGWFQGRLEFGDRALGNRSILADPRDPSMKDKVNETVKYREAFRPFAPAILDDQVDSFFEGADQAPFMEKAYLIRPEKRSVIPAVTHVDGTGRLQTVSRRQNPRFRDLIEAFGRLTGVPVVLNTSFNLKGEPIVCTPEDAIRTFYTSGLDALFLGHHLLRKG